MDYIRFWNWDLAGSSGEQASLFWVTQELQRAKCLRSNFFQGKSGKPEVGGWLGGSGGQWVCGYWV